MSKYLKMNAMYGCLVFNKTLMCKCLQDINRNVECK